jgi:hypothetical protein
MPGNDDRLVVSLLLVGVLSLSLANKSSLRLGLLLLGVGSLEPRVSLRGGGDDLRPAQVGRHRASARAGAPDEDRAGELEPCRRCRPRKPLRQGLKQTRIRFLGTMLPLE